MDMMQLQYFKIIAETGSLTKAAKQLHISQPAMSLMLKKFEEELNVELFDRTPNRIKLNKTGEIALIHVNNILRNVDQMKSDLLAYAQQNLSLSIAFCDPGVHWFCIPRFSYVHPEITVTGDLYENEDPIKLLQERTYDIAVTPKKIQHPSIQSMPFISDKVYLSVMTASELAKKEKISIKEIPAQPLLIPQLGGYFLNQLEKIVPERNPHITLVKNRYIVTQHQIRTTNFLATSSSLAIELRNDGTHRTLIPLEEPELQVLYHISYLKANKEKVSNFLTWAKNCKTKDNANQ